MSKLNKEKRDASMCTQTRLVLFLLFCVIRRSGVPWSRSPWRVGDVVVFWGNAGRTVSKIGHPNPCVNCSKWPPAETTGTGSLLNRPSCSPGDQIGQGTGLNVIQQSLYFGLFLPTQVEWTRRGQMRTGRTPHSRQSILLCSNLFHPQHKKPKTALHSHRKGLLSFVFFFPTLVEWTKKTN